MRVELVRRLDHRPNGGNRRDSIDYYFGLARRGQSRRGVRTSISYGFIRPANVGRNGGIRSKSRPPRSILKRKLGNASCICARKIFCNNQGLPNAQNQFDTTVPNQSRTTDRPMLRSPGCFRLLRGDRVCKRQETLLCLYVSAWPGVCAASQRRNLASFCNVVRRLFSFRYGH